ncbi:MAG: hypothetical protein L6N96_03705 [Candidatus Methylarchaceae archaeon HK02M2]|nr:hypothetical protein [Candidatus Methylarchaceae archaeon HK02M2]
MRGSKADVPKTLESSEVVIQEATWGDMHVGFETFKKRFDVTPLMRGLPNDRCQCPHWGYVIKGLMRVRYADREETVKAGDAYYIAPGHSATFEAGTELIEFSPKEKYQKTMEVVERNLAAMQQKK